jgi:lysozyme
LIFQQLTRIHSSRDAPSRIPQQHQKKFKAMDLRDQLVAALIRDESLRLKPYKDTVGKLTIGIGRNLDDVGISHDEALVLLNNDIDKASAQVRTQLPWTVGLDDARLAVLVNMAFNMGIGDQTHGLLAFHNTLALIQSGNYTAAADAMLQSKWAKQVGARAARLAEQMRTGQYQ